jgi:glycosyltransferase involved in cell wall biosynthesis
LVVLEAASLEIPVICFRSAGGIPEILSANTGGIRTVNYSDINEMATQVLILKENQNLRKAEGKLAKALVEDFKVDVSGRKIIDTINNFLENA